MSSWLRLQAPEAEEIKSLVEKLALRIFHHLKRKGYLKEVEGENQLAGEETDTLQSQSALLASCVAASVQDKTALYDRAGLYVRKLGFIHLRRESQDLSQRRSMDFPFMVEFASKRMIAANLSN